MIAVSSLTFKGVCEININILSRVSSPRSLNAWAILDISSCNNMLKSFEAIISLYINIMICEIIQAKFYPNLTELMVIA